MVLELLQEVFRVICNFQGFVGDGALLKTLRFVIVLTRKSETLHISLDTFEKVCREERQAEKKAGIKVIKRTREEDGLH